MSKSENTNCLEGRKCSGCESLGPFQIWSSGYLTWTDAGSGVSEPSSFQFTEDAKARCLGCNTAGTVQEVLPRPNPVTCDNPDCDSERFTAEAQITMKYLLDAEGDWIEDLGEDEPSSRVMDWSSLMCDTCGEEATER